MKRILLLALIATFTTMQSVEVSAQDNEMAPFPSYSVCTNPVSGKGKVSYFYAAKKLNKFCNAKKTSKVEKKCKYGEVYDLQSSPVAKAGAACEEVVTCCVSDKNSGV